MSSVCPLKHPYRIFSSHFCFLDFFLILLLLPWQAAVISLSLLFVYIFFESLYGSIHTFLNSCESCNIVYYCHFPGASSLISFFHWFIYSSLVQFKKCRECLIRETAHVFIPLMRFLLESLAKKFLVLLRYFFLIFSSVSVCLMVLTSNIRIYLAFLFLHVFWCFPDGIVLFLQFFLLLSEAWRIF